MSKSGTKGQGSGGDTGGGVALAARPKKRGKKGRGKYKSPLRAKIHELLTDRPDIGVEDVRTIVLGEHLTDNADTASRNYHKIRAAMGLSGAKKEVEAAPSTPAAAPVAKANPKPAGRTGAFERAVGAAVAGAKQGADADAGHVELDNLIRTRELLFRAQGKTPRALALEVCDVTQQVGGPDKFRQLVEYNDRLDAIMKVDGSGPATPLPTPQVPVLPVPMAVPATAAPVVPVSDHYSLTGAEPDANSGAGA